jgi:hypothetical protein
LLCFDHAALERQLGARSGRTQPNGIAMSAIVRTTDSSQTLRHVRVVPRTEVKRAYPSIGDLHDMRVPRAEAEIHTQRDPSCSKLALLHAAQRFLRSLTGLQIVGFARRPVDLAGSVLI